MAFPARQAQDGKPVLCCVSVPVPLFEVHRVGAFARHVPSDGAIWSLARRGRGRFHGETSPCCIRSYSCHLCNV